MTSVTDQQATPTTPANRLKRHIDRLSKTRTWRAARTISKTTWTILKKIILPIWNLYRFIRWILEQL